MTISFFHNVISKMLDVTTEIVYLPLKPNLDLSADEKKQQWEDTLDTIKRQPGVVRVLWGRQIENPNTVQLVVDWESLEAQKTFMDSPIYSPFLEGLNEQFLAGEPVLYHVNFPSAQRSYGDPFTSPVTEYISAFFRPDFPESQYDTQFAMFCEQAAQIQDVAANSLVGGWSIEEHPHEVFGEGVQGKLFVICAGWPNVEAHMAFRESEDFAKVSPHLRDGPVGRKLWHVALKQYK